MCPVYAKLNVPAVTESKQEKKLSLQKRVKHLSGSPDQNGVAERRNQTLLDMVKSMRSNVKLFSSCGLKYLR